MGFHLKIEGELKQWRRDGEFVRGTTKDEYGYTIEVNFKLKYPLVHYPEGRDTPEHYLARTSIGDYYYLALEEEKI